MSQSKKSFSFFRRVWGKGNSLIIKIPPEHADYYQLEGKFVKVTLEVLGDWKSKSQTDSTSSDTTT